MLITISGKEIQDRFVLIGYNIIDSIAEQLVKAGFPVKRKFPFFGNTVSKTEHPQLWIEEIKSKDTETGVCYKMFSTLVPGKPRYMYITDIVSSKFIAQVVESANKAYNAYVKYKEVDDWIESGGICVYRSGWGWKGAGACPISKEEAQKLKPKYSFGKGFWQLGWTEYKGQHALEFNELSANDML